MVRLDNKMLNVLTLFLDTQTISKKSYLKQTGMTEEEGREVLDELGNFLTPYAVIRKISNNPDNFLSIQVFDENMVRRLFEDLRKKVYSGMSLTEREIYIVERILGSNKPVKLETLANGLYVSMRQVSKYMQDVRTYLAQHNIVIRTIPYHGLDIAGTELDKRIALADLYSVPHTNTIFAEISNTTIGDIDVIRTMLGEILEKYNFGISDEAFENLVIHLAVMVLRIKSGNSINIKYDAAQTAAEVENYKIASEIIESMSKFFHITFDPDEIDYVAVHLSGKRFFREDEYKENISPDVISLVMEMLAYIDNKYNQKFHQDFKLCTTLALHMLPLINRVRYGLNQKNPILNEIKKNYLYEFEMAQDASQLINQKYSCHLSDDEIGYIALDLRLSRSERYTNKKNTILVVCASGRGSAALLRAQFEAQFSEYIDHMDLMPAREAEHKDLDQYDYVFTTVPIFAHTKTPIFKITAFLGNTDIQKINNVLTSFEREDLLKYFPEDLFMGTTDFPDKDTALREMTKYISGRRKVPDTFLTSVRERELASNTSFGNNVAFPHPISLLTDSTFVCIAINKKKIKWDENISVQLIIMASIENTKHRQLQSFYAALTKLVQSEKNVSLLIKEPQYGTLLSIINSGQ